MTTARPHDLEPLFVWTPPRSRYHDLDRDIADPPHETSGVRILYLGIGTGTRWGSRPQAPPARDEPFTPREVRAVHAAPRAPRRRAPIP
jgi:hypothetical protein